MAKLQIWNTKRTRHRYSNDEYELIFDAFKTDDSICFKPFIKNLTNKKIEYLSLIIVPVGIADKNIDPKRYKHKKEDFEPFEFKQLQIKRDICAKIKPNNSYEYECVIDKHNLNLISHRYEQSVTYAIWEKWRKHAIYDIKIIGAVLRFTDGTEDILGENDIALGEPKDVKETVEKVKKQQKRSNFFNNKFIPFIIAIVILLVMLLIFGDFDYSYNDNNSSHKDHNGDGEYDFSDYLKDEAPDLYNDIKDRYDSLTD